jgi:GTPase
MKPIITILGRPNVGKSTLFNRIAGGKKAIVWNEPGVTRDRNYADVTWDGCALTLIDTGGFEPVSKDRIFVQMREQCRVAMDEADAILFVMDGKEGLTPSDSEIVDTLRRQEKPVFYVVNKIDGPQHEEKALEFYRLGIDPIYSVSAEHGYGVGEVMDEIMKRFPGIQEEADDEEEATRVAVVGRPNVGKSSLINRFLGYQRVLVDEAPGTTRDAIDTSFVRNGKKYILVDTAGIRRKSRISLQLEKYSIVQALRTIDRCHVALLLLDPIEGVADQDARIGGFIHEKGKGCILVVNKWDTVEKGSTPKNFEKKIREDLKYLSYSPILFISARTGQRVSKVFETVDRVSDQTNKRVSTGPLNRHFSQWVEEHPPPLHKNRRVQLNYVAQVSVGPPTFVIYTNYPEGIYFSYERYLTNQMRKAFGFEGVPIRLLFRKKGKDR